MGNCGSSSNANENVVIIPTPCWVIKTKTKETMSKVFLNVVHHQKIPESPDKRNPRIFIGSRKTSKDKKGDECTVIDVLVHSAVVVGIDDGESPAASRLNRNIITLMNLAGEGDDDDALGMQFSIPKIPAGYKGDEVTPIEQTLIDFAASEKSKKSIPGKPASSTDVVLQNGDGSAVGGDEAMGGSVEVIDIEAHAGDEGKTAHAAAKKGVFGGWFGKGGAQPTDGLSSDAVPTTSGGAALTKEELLAKEKAQEAAAQAAQLEAERTPPPSKGGTFRKLGHFIPTMKTRYVYLDKGELSYYTDDKMTDCKKKMALADCYISNDSKIFHHQIYIAPLDTQSGKKANGRDLLLELLEEHFVTPDYKIEWIQAIRAHIKYATRMRIDAGLPSPF